MLRSRLVNFALALSAAGAFASTAAADDRPKRPTVAQRKAFAESLAAGRKAVKAKDYAAAITHLEAAKKIVPESPTVLGELGWAQFQAGDLEKAATATQDALYRSLRAKQMGALHYNMGRIEEARGNKESARSEYTESLGFRDNDTVKKRVNALGGPLKTAEQVDGHSDFTKALRAASNVYCAAPVPLESKTDGDNCGYKITRSEVLTGGGLDEFKLVHLEGYADDVGGSVDAELLLVRMGKYWFDMGIVADSYTPGVDYISNNGEVNSVEFSDLLPGLPGMELLIKSTNSNTDHDPGVELTSSGEQTAWRLCGVVAKKATCVELIGEAEWSENELKEDWEAGKQLSGSKWAVKIAVADDKIQLDAAGKVSDLPPAQQACLGSFALKDLMTKACSTTRVGK